MFLLPRPKVSPVPARLDAIDRKILKELQADGRITYVELASRVGISAPPCLRRVRALEEAGYIKGYRALLDEKKLGYEVTVFAMVHLASQAEADLVAFEEFVRAQPLVRECWMLSGEIDFVLKCVAPDCGRARRAIRSALSDVRDTGRAHAGALPARAPAESAAQLQSSARSDAAARSRALPRGGRQDRRKFRRGQSGRGRTPCRGDGTLARCSSAAHCRCRRRRHCGQTFGERSRFTQGRRR